MTDLTFTATVEAQYADELRAERALTDADIAAEYIRHPGLPRILRHRADIDAKRRRWSAQAIKDAAARVLFDASEDSQRSFQSADRDDETTLIATGDLEGAILTVTMCDLVATARLFVPAQD